MRKLSILIMAGLIMAACGTKDTNPFFKAYDTPYGAPPFDLIKAEHYLPAFEEGIKQQEAEIEAIANSSEEPDFENTIAALDYSGEVLTRVSSVFFNINGTDTDSTLQAINKEVTPKLSTHNDNLYLNKKLFERVKKLYDNKASLGLTTEQDRLLEKYYKEFVRSGAALDEAQQEKLREINKELGLLRVSFGENVLAETNNYKKFVDNEAGLAGLPETVISAAKEEAKAAGEPEKWLFTTKKSSFLPVLQYSDNRELRKELLMAYNNLANNNNENDNKEIVKKTALLRVEKAQLLGYDTHADFVLDEAMAKTPQAVYDFMETVWQPALKQAKVDLVELQKLMNADVKGQKLEPWDWWYYAEKLRKAKYDLDEEAIRAYFKMENVRQGAFDLATKLFGLNFTKVSNVQLYHPEVETFEVADADGTVLGLLYTDYYPRGGKRAGAWMSSFTKQYKKGDKNYRPTIINVGNFTKPTADKPSLLTMDEVETLFHEFGHALHGLLSQCTYLSLSGTSVPRDFVELPSQIMENWCFEPEMLKLYARHYETNEVIPDEYIKKINAASKFNQGFAMTELLSAAYLDMDFHTLKDTKDFDVTAFEKASMAKIGLIPEIVVRYRPTYFNHIFSGGYSSGYYSYVWAEVLDADAFEAFKESGDIFNKEIATSFRKNVLEKGGSEDPMKLYEDFRGSRPVADALLKRRGFK